MGALRSTLELAAVAPLLAVPIMVVTYCAMRLNMPIADEYLRAGDRLLGFDWPAMMRFVDSSPVLELLLQKGYVAFTPQALLLPMLLSLVRREARAYQFTFAFLLLGALASIISIFFPSLGAYVAYSFDGSTLRLIDPDYGNRFLESFNGVRQDADFTLSAGNAAGIITFPSVHAGAAVLCAWAAWPSQALRYPVLALNGMMFASALTHGGHFLIDLFAGAGVAALCIRLAVSVCRRRADLPNGVASYPEPAPT
jgi:membrane-associated phospholipid phosphatase